MSKSNNKPDPLDDVLDHLENWITDRGRFEDGEGRMKAKGLLKELLKGTPIRHAEIPCPSMKEVAALLQPQFIVNLEVYIPAVVEAIRRNAVGVPFSPAGREDGQPSK